MHSNIVVVYLEGRIEFIRIRDDIRSDVKVSCPDVILVKELVEAIRWLYKREDENQDSLENTKTGTKDAPEEDRHRTRHPQHPRARYIWYRGSDNRMNQSRLEDWWRQDRCRQEQRQQYSVRLVRGWGSYQLEPRH